MSQRAADEAERQKRLHDALLRACEDYNADEAIRAMASAMTTLLIGFTKDLDAALAALERLVVMMVAQVQNTGRPRGAANQ
jgi:glutamate/tyrosine decarboxylase-like PLP-dependent enzyme